MKIRATQTGRPALRKICGLARRFSSEGGFPTRRCRNLLRGEKRRLKKGIRGCPFCSGGNACPVRCAIITLQILMQNFQHGAKAYEHTASNVMKIRATRLGRPALHKMCGLARRFSSEGGFPTRRCRNLLRGRKGD